MFSGLILLPSPLCSCAGNIVQSRLQMPGGSLCTHPTKAVCPEPKWIVFINFLNASFQIGGSKYFHGDLLHRSAGNFPITAHCPSMLSPIDTGIFSAASLQIRPQLLSWFPASKKAKGKNATSRLCPLSCLAGAPGHNHSIASAMSHTSSPDCRYHQEFQMEVKDTLLVPKRGSF